MLHQPATPGPWQRDEHQDGPMGVRGMSARPRAICGRATPRVIVDTTDPIADWTDPVPQNETKRDLYRRLLAEGGKVYALRRFREIASRSPKEWEKS